MLRLVCSVVCDKTKNAVLSYGRTYATRKSVSSCTEPYTRVADFYAGKSVFVTGATGFVGKVLIERLLFNCQDIGNVYVLIRPRVELSTEKRLQEILNVPLFTKLKQMRPGNLKKLIPIEGDITEPQLGIKPADEKNIVDKVSVVFHSAATVKFTDTFQKIMNVNVEGTQRVMDLCKKINNLEKLVYISTAYSNTHKKVISEYIYPPQKTVEEVRLLLRDHGDDVKKINEYVANIPNTYTHSKALCEELLSHERGNLPIIIVRPSIVTAVYQEPLPGWVDSWVAATATFSNVSRGLMPVIYGTDDVVCDIIPVDYVSNLIIVAGAKGNVTRDISVYNICSSSENPITWKHGSDLFLEESTKNNTTSKIPRKLFLAKSTFVVKTITFVLQTIPCFFADVGLIIRGEKPRHMIEQNRSILLRDIIRTFSTSSWLIKSNNTRALIASLDEHDKKTFPCDVNNINWNDYFKIFYKGVKEFLLKGK